MTHVLTLQFWLYLNCLLRKTFCGILDETLPHKLIFRRMITMEAVSCVHVINQNYGLTTSVLLILTPLYTTVQLNCPWCWLGKKKIIFFIIFFSTNRKFPLHIPHSPLLSMVPVFHFKSSSHKECSFTASKTFSYLSSLSQKGHTIHKTI